MAHGCNCLIFGILRRAYSGASPHNSPSEFKHGQIHGYENHGNKTVKTA